MRPRWIILAVLLASPIARAQLLPEAGKIGPRLLQAMSKTPRASTPIELITVWNAPPGLRPGACVGRVCAETCRPDGLAALLASPDLVSVDLPARLRPRLDVAGPLVGAPQARAWTHLRGAGVLIAIIDTGLDWTHPDFIDDQGHTRVAWLLDQGRPPAGLHPELEQLGQGAVFSADEIDTALDSGTGPVRDAGLDAVGHGTHVAGIAAGDDPVYTGVAPRARLVVVKAIDADLTGFSEDRILAGLAFARAVALREDQPLVVNLSLGNQVGAHDGSEPIELALEALAGDSRPPCAVTVAAGNESGLAIHARAAVQAGGPSTDLELLLPQTAQASADLPARVLVDLWAEGNSHLTVVIQAPSGWRSDEVSPGPTASAQTEWSPDGLVDISTPSAPNPFNGFTRLVLTLRGEAGLPLSQGTWTIRLTGQSRRIDAWIGEWDLAGGPVPRFVNWIEANELVGPPATARGVIAVGSMDARTRWPGIDGVEYGLTGAVTGQLSSFSALGPTRDGRPKPELVAPGRTVASSMSAQASAHSPSSIFYTGGSQRKVLPDGLHAVASGTSMAAPFAAGACALALEREPTLTGRDLLGRLQVSSGADEWTGHGLFEPGWGFGKLAIENLLATRPQIDLSPDTQASLCGAARGWIPIDSGQLVQITAVPKDAKDRPLGPGHRVEIDAAEAEFAGPVIDQGNGLYTRAMTGAGPRGARIRPVCTTDGQPAAARPVVVLAGTSAEAAGGGVRGGPFGCAAIAPVPGPGAAMIWLVGWVGLLWIRKRSSRNRRRRNTRCKPIRPRTR